MSRKPAVWSPEEDALMLGRYPELGPKGMHELLPHRNRRAIECHARKLEVKFAGAKCQWSAADDAYLTAHYTSSGAIEVAAHLGRSVVGVRTRAHVLGIHADRSAAATKGAKKRDRANERTKGRGPSMRVMQARAKPGLVPLQGEPKITSETRVTIARPFVDTRFVPVGPVPRVVDPAQCRGWAAAV